MKLSRPCRNAALVFFVLASITACASPPLRIESDFIPPGSLRVAQVVWIGKRAQVFGNSVLHHAMTAAGIPDMEIVDGSAVLARIFCCGGVTQEMSSEFVNRTMLYVPSAIRVEVGDFVEVRVGHSPQNGDGGRLNTVTKVVAREGDKPETCWWDPRNPKLWLRVPYCEWMPREGWTKQGGVNPAWYKPAG